ncbi:MAG: ribonuclease E [Candidatus Brocadia sp.]|nr:Ribonuclease E [Candidatus Brocadia fulgida]MCC6326422.1 Rne/Rng family ribonuclease [Candidatus Brocadia sp.]MCE7911696.1 Rne/Rng family ribonuclease [Candidatus Brocadia sp. AMX3]MDG5995677.1 Rne/Rng family ribonuclease [Candidatus Brocadia sp.]RIJ96614.1 MAG: ribonuclease E [Candidatus Brocadia sp.]
MDKKMLINAVEPEECRIAILENNVLEELYIERSSREQIAGNIYKGRVVNIEPSIEAAFVDIGLKKNGFLHASDVFIPSENGSQSPDTDAHGKPHREFRKIRDILHPGKEVLVQVTKESIGTKGPSLTTYISLPGRFLVLTPDVPRHGVSRKIASDEERLRLKKILAGLNPPANIGFIIRTAGEQQTKKEIHKDFHYLLKLWKNIEKRTKDVKAPATIYQESDLVIRVIRDIFSTNIQEIIVDTEAVYERTRDFLRMIMPKSEKLLTRYSEDKPLFHKYNIEQEIEEINCKKIRLPRGGSIVIEQTEALVAIDVNSGKFKEESDPEETAFKTNLKAAKEIARQIRLRDLGGMIVIDFIDMRTESHIRAIEKVIVDALKRDKARTKMLKMSKFGTIELTRQRIRSSLRDVLFEECKFCRGTGYAKTVESLCLNAMRDLKFAMYSPQISKIEIFANPAVANYLQNQKRKQMIEIEESYNKKIHIFSTSNHEYGKVDIRYLNQKDEPVVI